MNLEIDRIVADIKMTTHAIQPLKAQLRRRWVEPMASVQRELVRLKRRATELCVLRAHLRGRLHVRTPPAGSPTSWNADEHATRVAARVALAYARQDREPAA